MTTHADGPPAAYNGGYAPATAPVVPQLPLEQPVATGPARSAAATRRSTRRGLIISVLVVLVGGVVAFAGAQILTKHSRVLAVSSNVPIGATITANDLTVASVTKDRNLSPVPASQKSQVVGTVAQVGLVKGELLTRGQFGPSSAFTAGQMLVALALKQGQFPARGLAAGQQVLIVSTPGTNALSGATTGAGAGGPSSVSSGSGAGIDATVAEVGSLNAATQVTVVDVRVDAAAGVSVAQLASTGNLAVILLPAGR